MFREGRQIENYQRTFENMLRKTHQIFIQNRPKIEAKRRASTKSEENRFRERHRNHFFGPGCDFGRFLGPGSEPKFNENAVENAPQQKAEKTTATRDKDATKM